MRRHRWERGEGNLGCMIWALVVVLIFYVGWKMIPVKMKNAQLQDFIVDQAKFAEHRGAHRTKQAILYKAKELGIPLDAKHVSVERRGDHIYMKAEYTIPIHFVGGYTYEWHFMHDVDRPLFIF